MLKHHLFPEAFPTDSSPPRDSQGAHCLSFGAGLVLGDGAVEMSVTGALLAGGSHSSGVTDTGRDAVKRPQV